jgi:hypothetical protein
MTISNQWPDFLQLMPSKSKTVRRVLIEEGSGLGEKTKGDITFVVDTTPSGLGGFLHQCFLYVPKIGYRYPLMRVEQKNGVDYPVEVVASPPPHVRTANDEKELRKALGTLFQSEMTKSVVLQLLDLLS